MQRRMQTQLVVLGGGPGGYAAAFKAADMGKQVSLVDSAVDPGGVCLYRGCIPSKALLHAARIITDAAAAASFGIAFDAPRIDPEALRLWKNGVVKKLTSGLGHLCRMRNITYVQGTGSFSNDAELRVRGADGSEQLIGFEHAVIATGSVPVRLPFAPESDRIWDSSRALELPAIPSRLLIVGAGYIGLEQATIYAALGSTVTIVEAAAQILPGADAELSRILRQRLKKTLGAVHVHCKVRELVDGPNGVRATLQPDQADSFTQEYDAVLIAVGRVPFTRGIGMDQLGVRCDEQGFIQTDQQCKTTHPRVYAIGDVRGQPMLAHKAAYEGKIAAEAICGKKSICDARAMPAVIFTDPEIAWCGLSEAEATEQSREVTVVKFPWQASGRAATLHRSDGLTKLICDKKTGRILGAGMVGVGCGELIAEAALAIEMAATAGDVALTIHPHPTLSESIMETAEGVFGRSTHFMGVR